MEIINDLGKKEISKKTADGSDASLMLAKDGSYLWIGAVPASRYQGWFLTFHGDRPIKIIEEIRPRDRKRVDALSNDIFGAKIISDHYQETFYLPERQVLRYELDKFVPVEIFFDVKDIYDSPEFGRNYRVWKEDGAIMVGFKQEGGSMPEIFAAIWGDFGIVEINEEWLKRDYKYDRGRGDLPCERWVFKPADICASRVLVAVALTKEEAIMTARKAWRDMAMAKSDEPALDKNGQESWAGLAEQAAARSLEMLKTDKGGKPALRAGLPWFFQIWRRDEAVSLRGLSFIDPTAAKEIFWRQIEELAAEGYKFADSADAAGWLFLRAKGFIEEDELSTAETERIFGILEKLIKQLRAENTKNDLAINGPKQTWMDSLERAGAAIEIQALRLNMYYLAAHIADSEEKKNHYHDLGAAAWIRVREKFFCGGKLADNFDHNNGKADFRARPNVFLAAYVYPGLFKKSEWEKIFDNALEELWLDWGGLSTLDKSDAEFCRRDTGVDPAAYHNGDSWFWVNNLAALVLERLDREKYASYVKKIFNASADDILRYGAIGCASEISSADNYSPVGCVNQAWSNATFLELCAELDQ